MSSKQKIYNLIAYAKICSSKVAYNYVIATNNGKETDDMLCKLRLIRSYIKSVESYAGLKRKIYYSNDNCGVTLICVKNCFNSKEICNIVNKLKTICKSC